MKHTREDYNRIQDPAGLIPEDEPVFLLRGQDIIAPLILFVYAEEARRRGLSEIANKTFSQAEKMQYWQQMQRAKLPDI